jgi:glutamate carboxypeptidase
MMTTETLLSNLAWLDDEATSMLSLVRTLSDINSGTSNLEGLKTITDVLVREYSTLGGELTVCPSHPFCSINDDGLATQQRLGDMIFVSKWPEAARRVLLCIHMDTVYPVDHPFQKCSLMNNGNLLGPGVADAKGGIVVMLHALRTLEHSSLAGKIGWDVLINADEEIGSPGSQEMIDSLAPQSEFGLLFEPSLPDGTLVSWRKGSGNFVFVVRGRSAHAGREFALGRNAIVAMSRLMSQIDQLNTDPEITFNVGKVTGGGPLNVVPELAIGRVNVRVKTVEQSATVEQHFARLVAEFNQLDGISVSISGKFSSPPKPICPRSIELQRRIESCGHLLGIPIRWQGTGGACDGNKFAAAGLPNIDTLGPAGGNIHSPAEYLIPSSLVPRTKLAASVLLSFADQV